jgi:hypothetical protein
MRHGEFISHARRRPSRVTRLRRTAALRNFDRDLCWTAPASALCHLIDWTGSVCSSALVMSHDHSNYRPRLEGSRGWD